MCVCVCVHLFGHEIIFSIGFSIAIFDLIFYATRHPIKQVYVLYCILHILNVTKSQEKCLTVSRNETPNACCLNEYIFQI